MKQFFVYAHCREDLTPFYIGKGTLARAHMFSRRSASHREVVAEVGRANVIVEMLACPSEAEAFFRERLVIRSLRLANVQLCNLTSGGQGMSGIPLSEKNKAKLRARVVSPETRAKLAAAAKGNQRFLGLTHSPEVCARISLLKIGNAYGSKNKGRIVSEETKAKLSVARQRRVITQATRDKMRGRKASAETKLKMSLAHQGKPASKPPSAETRAKISATLKARYLRGKN